MEKEILQNYLKEGYSLNQVSKLTGKIFFCVNKR